MRHAGNFLYPAINTTHFYFFVAEIMSHYLTTVGLKKFSLLPEAPLRPEARGICHICHMVNPALPGTHSRFYPGSNEQHRLFQAST